MTTLKVLEFNGVCSNELRTAQPQNACRRTPALWRKDTVFRCGGKREKPYRYNDEALCSCEFYFNQVVKKLIQAKTSLISIPQDSSTLSWAQ